jgi:integrase
MRSAREKYRLVFQIAYLAGLRCGEILKLRREDLDLEKRTIRVGFDEALGDRGGIKTGQERLVPICAELAEILAKHTGAGYMFPGAKGGVITNSRARHMLRCARDRAGIPDATYHVLRHSRASSLLSAGVPAVRVSKILGNTVPVLLSHYAGLEDGYHPDIELGDTRQAAAPTAPPVAPAAPEPNRQRIETALALLDRAKETGDPLLVAAAQELLRGA